MVVYGGLQIAEKAKGKRRKDKGERERYIQLNAEFQRTTRRGKKAFLNEQYREIEEENRMGKTGNLFKKIGDIKGTFHGRMGTIQNRNGKGLTKAEEIKKRQQQYTELHTKKVLMIWITMMVWSLT